VENGKAPEGRRGAGVDGEATGDGADEFVPGLGDAVLLGRVREGIGGGDATRGVVGRECAVEEFSAAAINGATTVGVDALDAPIVVKFSGSNPGDDGGGGIGLGFEKDGRAKSGGVVDDSEEEAVAIAVGGFGGEAEVHVNFVEGFP